MTDPFLAEVIMFAGNFNPRGWALCDGQILSISQYTAVFSLVGTTYGGDGRTTFGLPEMRGRVAVHKGNGPGLTPIALGQRGGTNNNTLIPNNLPAHTHPLPNNASEETQNATNPHGNGFATGAIYRSDEINARTLPNATNNNSTSNSPVNNMQPYLALNFIFALQGTFPSPN